MSLLQNKKAMELSINFLVVIIIGMTMFSLALGLLYKVVNKAEAFKGNTLDELQESIGYLTCKTSDQICFDSNRKQIRRGEFDLFGMKLLNINSERTNFRIGFQPVDLRPAGKDASKLYQLPPSTDIREIAIEPNNVKDVIFAIDVPKATEPGTYIFNVLVDFCIKDDGALSPVTCEEDSDWFTYKESVYKLNVVVP